MKTKLSIGFIFFVILNIASCKKDDSPEKKVYKRIKAVYEIKTPLSDTIPVEEFFYEGERLTIYKKYLGYSLFKVGTVSYEGNSATIRWVNEMPPTNITDHEYLIEQNKIIKRRLFLVNGDQQDEYLSYNYEYNGDKLTGSRQYSYKDLYDEYILNYSYGKLSSYSRKNFSLSDTLFESEKGVYSYTDGHISECFIKYFYVSPWEDTASCKKYIYRWSGDLLTELQLYLPKEESWIPDNILKFTYDNDGYLIKDESGYHKFIFEYEEGKGNAALFAVDPLQSVIYLRPSVR